MKKENIHLKQQLETQKNDVLSDSFLKMSPTQHYKTIDQSETYPERSEENIYSVSSQGNTRKIGLRKEDIKSLGARTDEASSNQGSTYHRGTGVSMFPSLSKGKSIKSSSKILDRIMEIERVKQSNKLKLEHNLEMLSNKRNNQD